MKFTELKVLEGNFRSYDVRGEYPNELDASTGYAIARAFLQYNPAKIVAVGADHRASSPDLKQGLIQGLLDGGATVWDLGQVTTDMTYFASWHYEEVEGTVMITASHMPAQFNGFKFITKDLAPIGRGSGMEELYQLASNVEPLAEPVQGEVIEKTVLSDYVSWLHSFVNTQAIKPFKVLMDCGNGVAGPIVEAVFQDVPVEMTKLCFEPDSTFPNHEANPIEEKNRAHIIEEMKQGNYDLAIAWDADADRAYFLDEKGDFIHGDFVTALLAKVFLKKHPGAHIVYDLRASNVVPETVEKAGGVAHRERVGHAHIKKTMRATKSVFGGEVSGHYYFADNQYMDNGFLPPLLMLELLAKSEQPLSELIASLGDYYVSGEINSKVADQQAVMQKLKEVYADAEMDELDGISIAYPDWHFNVRPSANDPVIRLNLEASSQALMEEKRDEVLGMIRNS